MAKAQKQSVTTQTPPAPVTAGALSGSTPPAKAAPVSTQAPTATVTQLRTGPTHDQIARRAYEIFLARGGIHGHEQEDWAQAERELALGRY